MRRALLIKFGAIGDVVMAIPAAHALYASGIAVEWVCGAAVAPLLALYPWIKPIVIDDRALLTGTFAARAQAMLSLWRAVAGPRYDLAATLYYDPRFRLLALPIRAQRKVMLSATGRATRLLPGRRHTDEYARILLGRADGVTPRSLAPIRPDPMPANPLPREPGILRVVLAPAGARNLLRDDALRRWPAESYVEAARALASERLEVVLIGGEDDGWVSPLFAGVPVTNLIGKLSLPETLGLLDQSDAFLTHDTGPLHLAGLTSVGIVSLFGPTDPHGRLPQRRDAMAIWGGEGFACRPCYDGHNYAPCKENGCLRQITPALAVAAVRQMLSERAMGGAPPFITAPASTVTA